MILKEKYDSFTQRLAVYFCALLAPKKKTETFSGVSQDAFSQLHDFFSEFYRMLYEKPETLLADVKGDVCLKYNEHKSKNQAFKKVENVLKPSITDFIDFLYTAGQTGNISGNTFYAKKVLFEKYISKRKRDKLRFLEGLSNAGLHVSASDDDVVLWNNKYPLMFEALRIFALRCAENHHKQGTLCFTMCDFGAMDTQYELRADEILGRIIACNSEYSYLLDLHNYMSTNGCSIEFKQESDIALVVFYTNRKIKSSPLLGIQFDVRYDEPLCVNIRFVSTSRLTPIAGTLSNEMQEAFYNDTGYCRGADCGWCKNQKGLLHPSELKVKDKHKIICWYAQKTFTKVNEKDLDTIYGYIKFHELLAE
jgi:hypothetical protein